MKKAAARCFFHSWRLVVEAYQITKLLNQIEKKMEMFATRLKENNTVETIQQLEQEMEHPDFWNDNKRAQKTIQTLKMLKNKYQTFLQLQETQSGLIELLAETSESDAEIFTMIELEFIDFQSTFQTFEIEMLLSGENDNQAAIMEINPGAGGTESQDWAEMLYRMYTRFAEKEGYKVEVLNFQNGDEAGIKNATLRIEGPYAYGFLKAESGVHRLVRISPFDSGARRHTSFASVHVTPDIENEIEIEIKDSDLKIDTFRSSGAGGQSVNTTDSAVRITHLPTGIVATCQNERSQISNRDKAMQMLKSKLYQKEQEEAALKKKQLAGEKAEIGFGSQIRSYVFHPYALVKDHRTNFEVGNVQAVMDGDIKAFIENYLQKTMI